MAFKKGRSGNPKGRPKGAENKAGKGLRMLIADFLENRFGSIVHDFEQLEPKDRIKVFTYLLQYAIPKMQPVSSQIEFENLTDQQLDSIINELIKSNETIQEQSREN